MGDVNMRGYVNTKRPAASRGFINMKQVEASAADNAADAKGGRPEGSPADRRQDMRLFQQMKTKKGGK